MWCVTKPFLQIPKISLQTWYFSLYWKSISVNFGSGSCFVKHIHNDFRGKNFVWIIISNFKNHTKVFQYEDYGTVEDKQSSLSIFTQEYDSLQTNMVEKQSKPKVSECFKSRYEECVLSLKISISSMINEPCERFQFQLQTKLKTPSSVSYQSWIYLIISRWERIYIIFVLYIHCRTASDL